MKLKTYKLLVILALALVFISASGCLSSSAGDRGGTVENDGTSPQLATVTPSPSSAAPIPGATDPPGGSWGPWTPGAGDDYGGLPGTDETNRTPVTPTPVPTPTPTPVVSATTADWGTDKDTYARGDTATGRVNVTNTGNVPIDQIDFTVIIKRTIFFVPVERSFSDSQTGLNILPGETRRLEFSQAIPADYEGISTAGDYRFTVTASLAGSPIGSYSKDIRVV